MTKEKFIYEITTVTKFIQIYCDDKHAEELKFKDTKTLGYNKEKDVITTEFSLCKECKDMLFYAYERLKECPHTQKPRCHRCPHPCYELSVWKNMAKMMRYSGMKLGLSKIKRLFLG